MEPILNYLEDRPEKRPISLDNTFLLPIAERLGCWRKILKRWKVYTIMKPGAGLGRVRVGLVKRTADRAACDQSWFEWLWV
jgi:hypothetical protein